MNVKIENTSPGATPGHWANNSTNLCKGAIACKPGKHRLVNDAKSAQLIIFTGDLRNGIFPYEIWTNPLFRKFPEKCVRFSTTDDETVWLPGIYASLEKSRFCGSVRGGFFPCVAFSEYVHEMPSANGNKSLYLYSFLGAFETCPIRNDLGRIHDTRAFIEDTSHHPGRGFGQPEYVYDEFHSRFYETLIRSKFILCPRGRGTSSMRLFETMKAGRVPVVVSDDWVPPDGPDWGRFSLQVPEGKIEKIPEIVREAEERHPEMAKAAFDAWRNYFSKNRFFDHIIDIEMECLSNKCDSELIGIRAHQIFSWRFAREGLARQYKKIVLP